MGTRYLAIVEDLRAEGASLDQVLRNLMPNDFDVETQSPGWKVRDQVRHLTFFDRAGVQALANPLTFTRDRIKERGDKGSGSLSASGVPYSQLISVSRQANEELLAALVGVEGNARIEWFGPPMSALTFATSRLMEKWAHGWDIREALGIEAPQTRRLRHVAHLGVLTRMWSFVNRGIEAPVDDVFVRLDGPNESTWEWGEPESENRVLGSALDFSLVVTQRRRLRNTDLAAEGETAHMWMEIAQCFAGAPTVTLRATEFDPANQDHTR